MPGSIPYRRVYGQFFTPERVVACCYALLEGALPPSPRIVDPACGDGAFLRYAAGRLAAPRDLAGCDLDARLVEQLAAQGLVEVRHADGLDPSSLPARSFDLVIGNPPYGVETPSRSGPASEVRFLLRAIELARPCGVVALVLPCGVLANERLRDLRATLLQRCTLLAAIDLPRATFRAEGTDAACSLVMLRVAPAPAGHRAFFGVARDLDDLPALVAAYRERAADGRSSLDPHASEWFWLPQNGALAQRMDARFWRPAYQALLERMAARYPLRPLGALIDRSNLIAGDHVRPSQGEAKGAGLPYEYYQTREFMAAGYNYAAVERCDERAYCRLKRTAVRQHDILVSCAGIGGAGNGRVCLITHQPGPSCTGDVFILRVGTPNPIFLFLFLTSHGGRAQLQRLQNGVGTANLSADELLQLEVPCVPIEAQRALAECYAPVAAAHEQAMAALAYGDAHAFGRWRAQSEALLEGLRASVEALTIGGDG